MLSARTAAAEVLRALDAKGPPAPAGPGSTLEAPAVDQGGVASTRTALRPTSDWPGASRERSAELTLASQRDLSLQRSSSSLAASLEPSTRAAGTARAGSARSGTTLAAAVVLAAVVAGVAVAVMMRSSSSPSPRANTPDFAASDHRPPAPAQTTPPGEPEPTGMEAHHGAVVPSLAITSSAAVPTPSVVAIPTSSVAAAPPRPVVATPTPSAPRNPARKKAPAEALSAPAEPKSNCDPNYYLDAQGEKHFKLECFK